MNLNGIGDVTTAFGRSRPRGRGDRRETPATSLEPFRRLAPRARGARLLAHLELIRERDGEIDPCRLRLPAREQLLERLAASPVRWTGDLAGRGAAPGEPRAAALRAAWLRAVAKANEGEAFGVELELERFVAAGLERVDPHLLQVALEDRHHTRMLGAAYRVFGGELEIGRPGVGMRLLIRAMNRLPDTLRFVLVLCGEVAGAVLFQVLLERCSLFRAQPEVEARLRLIVGRIAEDELGHVAYFGARLPPPLVRCARVLMPCVGTSLLAGLPEFAMLGGGRRRLLRRMCAPLGLPAALAALGRVG